MDAIKAITERVSVPQLTGPDITMAQKETLYQAALRAPDHAWLRPSRYISISGDARSTLGEIFLQSTSEWESLSEERQQKLRGMLQRAPLVIVAVTRVQDHPKVPRDELLLSTGAGIQNMLTAAWALGLGAIWRTGDMVHSEGVRQALELTTDDVITGFVYIGHVNCTLKQPPVMLSTDFVSEWNGETLVKTND